MNQTEKGVAIDAPTRNSEKRRQRLRQFVNRLRKRHGIADAPAQAISAPPRPRGLKRKRKTALAVSAGVMGLSTAATGVILPGDQSAATYTLQPGIDYRVSADMLSASEALMEVLAEEEGVRLTVYRDPIGLPTVGVGHLVQPSDGLHLGQTISYDEAIDLLESDLRAAENAVRRLVGELTLYQHEFDALVDLVYNIGEGNVSERRSPDLNRAIANGDYEAIAEELDYQNAAGIRLRGLALRSERRAQMFLDASYDDPRGEPATPLARTA